MCVKHFIFSKKAKQSNILVSLSLFCFLCTLSVAKAQETPKRFNELPLNEINPIDFFIQNVCLDADRNVIMNESPLSAKCASTRDLLPGEELPYHKVTMLSRDESLNQSQNEIYQLNQLIGAYTPSNEKLLNWPILEASSHPSFGGPNAEAIAKIWRQVTRHDDIAIDTVFGTAGVRVSDNFHEDKAAKDIKKGFWSFESGPDSIHGPYIKTDKGVWVAFAMDHSGPYKNVSAEFCNPESSSPYAANDMKDKNASREANFQLPLISGVLTKSGNVPKPRSRYSGLTGACPIFNKGDLIQPSDEITNVGWNLGWMRHPIGLGENPKLSPPLLTLYNVNQKVAEAGKSLTHIEPVYFTRELGQVRHESWDNIHPDVVSPGSSHYANLIEAAQKIRREKTCEYPHTKPPFKVSEWKVVDDPTTGLRTFKNKNERPKELWVLVSCRQVSATIPAYDLENGDNPRVWKRALTNIDLSAELISEDNVLANNSFLTQPVIKKIFASDVQGKVLADQSNLGKVGTFVSLDGLGFSVNFNTVILGERECSLPRLSSYPVGLRDKRRRVTFQVPIHCDDGPTEAKTYSLRLFNGHASSAVANPTLTVSLNPEFDAPVISRINLTTTASLASFGSSPDPSTSLQLLAGAVITITGERFSPIENTNKVLLKAMNGAKACDFIVGAATLSGSSSQLSFSIPDRCWKTILDGDYELSVSNGIQESYYSNPIVKVTK